MLLPITLEDRFLAVSSGQVVYSTPTEFGMAPSDSRGPLASPLLAMTVLFYMSGRCIKRQGSREWDTWNRPSMKIQQVNEWLTSFLRSANTVRVNNRDFSMMLHLGEPKFWEISEEYINLGMLVLRAGGSLPLPGVRRCIRVPEPTPHNNDSEQTDLPLV